MMLPHIYSDAMGHSLLGEVELKEARSGMGLSAALQKVAFWEMSLSEPGDSFDFQPTDMNRVLVVLSGQVDLGVSNGDAISLSRGDLLFQTDLMGQGHKAKFVGM